MNEKDIDQEQSQEQVEAQPQTQTASAHAEDTQTENTQTNNTQAKSNQFRNRLINMLVLAISTGIAGSVLFALIIGQTLFGLFTKEPNESMKALAKQLSDYIYKTLQYLSFNSEERPFPYQVWDEKKEGSILAQKM